MLPSEEKLKDAGLDAEERDTILSMARSSADIFAYTKMPLEQMTEDQVWDRKMDYYDGYIDAMADAMALIMDNINSRRKG